MGNKKETAVMQNPIENLSLEELIELKNNKQLDFILTAKYVDGETITIYDGTKHFNVYKNFLQYIVNEKITLKKGSELLDVNYGEIADLLIQHEILKRKSKNNEENLLFRYIVQKSKQKTAVELIIEALDIECKSRGMNVNWDMYLEMEKQEMIEFANDLLAENDTNYIGVPNLAEQYYEQTYGGQQ
jgi:hypothetical protein